MGNVEPSARKPSIEGDTKIDKSILSYSIKGINADPRILVEPDVDPVLKKRKLNQLGQPHDEMKLTTDS